jgi:hypothetical protein
MELAEGAPRVGGRRQHVPGLQVKVFCHPYQAAVMVVQAALTLV